MSRGRCGGRNGPFGSGDGYNGGSMDIEESEDLADGCGHDSREDNEYFYQSGQGVTEETHCG